MRTTETYSVVADNLPELRFRIARLNKKAGKLGMAPIVLTEGKSTVKKLSVDSEHVEGAYKREVVYVEVTLEGETPVISGWQFVALLQHEDGGTIVKAIPGVPEGTLKKFRNADSACDHCRTVRRRNDTFVVQHAETRELKQVGRNCLKDFTGHENPHALASAAELLMVARESCIDGGEFDGFGCGGGGGSAFGMSRFLGMTIAAIRDGGWLSRTKAKEQFREGHATADRVVAELTRKLSSEPVVKGFMPDDVVEAERLHKLVEEHFEKANADALNDYEHNLRVVVLSGYVSIKAAGIAASLIGYARRLEAAEIEKRAVANGERKHVGTVGERATMQLTIASIGVSENAYGLVTYVNFRDADGNRLVWKASGSPRALGTPEAGQVRLDETRLKIGSTYEVTGTIDSHKIDRRDGITPETWLKRCVLAEPGVAEWQAEFKKKAAVEKKAAAKAKREAAKAAKKAAEGGEAAPAPTSEVTA